VQLRGKARVEAIRRRIDSIVQLRHWCDGFRYLEHAISFPESSAIAYRCQHELDHAGAKLETGACCNGRSRVVRFGTGLHGESVGTIPGWARTLRDTIARRVIGVARADHVTINEYAPGDSIWPHTDDFGYDTPIVSVSVGAPARFVLSRETDDGSESIRIEAAHGSAIVLERDAARLCKHAIEAWTEQPGTRWSIVFRVRRVVG
jgi:hypothetical protein